MKGIKRAAGMVILLIVIILLILLYFETLGIRSLSYVMQF